MQTAAEEVTSDGTTRDPPLPNLQKVLARTKFVPTMNTAVPPDLGPLAGSIDNMLGRCDGCAVLRQAVEKAINTRNVGSFLLHDKENLPGSSGVHEQGCPAIVQRATATRLH